MNSKVCIEREHQAIGIVIVAFVLIGQIAFAQQRQATKSLESIDSKSPFLVVLGIAQDAGFPQAGCHKECCRRVWNDQAQRRHVVCVGIVDPVSGQRWLLECTPDFREQLHRLDLVAPPDDGLGLDGILLTHAHIGHYSGLIHLGREVMGADRVPVHAMPRMKNFLESHGPWSQLVSAKNISIQEMSDGAEIRLNQRISITPFLVPHRDEFSESVGFRIVGPSRSAIFLPDIDKWDRWDTEIEDVLSEVDVAYLDGTFYANGELPGRDMSKIPHPFIAESLARFSSLPKTERNKVRFLHFNHTNPVLDSESKASKHIRDSGCHVTVEGERFEL